MLTFIQIFYETFLEFETIENVTFKRLKEEKLQGAFFKKRAVCHVQRILKLRSKSSERHALISRNLKSLVYYHFHSFQICSSSTFLYKNFSNISFLEESLKVCGTEAFFQQYFLVRFLSIFMSLLSTSMMVMMIIKRSQAVLFHLQFTQYRVSNIISRNNQ